MKYAKLFIFSAAAMVSSVVLRCLQLVFLTDPKSGFFVSGSEGLGNALSVITILLIALTCGMALFAKPEAIRTQPTPSPILGCAALLAGISHLMEPFLNGISMPSVPTWMTLLRLLMILAAGGVFCWFGVAHLMNLDPRYPLCLVLILSWIVRLMSTFISFTGMSNISENLYDVLMLILTLAFFLIQGKTLCGVSRKRHPTLLLALGLAAVLCTAVSALPGMIVSFTSNTELTHIPTDNPISAIFTALYICVYLVNLCRDIPQNT